MGLMLEVVSAHAASMGANARRALGETELRLGREADNDWVFPQAYVSRRQAIVRCVNGMYFLEQMGSCPVTLNGQPRPLERNQIVRLSPGDRILIDDIAIEVIEMPEASDAPGASIAFAPAAGFPGAESRPAAAPLAGRSAVGPVDVGPRAVGPVGGPGAGRPGGGLLGDLGIAGARSVDPLELLGAGAAEPRHDPAASRASRALDLGSILDEALPVSAVPAGAGTGRPAGGPALSDDWFTGGRAGSSAIASPSAGALPSAGASPGANAIPSPGPASRAPSPGPAAPASGASAGRGRAPAPAPSAGLDDLLRGAGLDPREASVDPEVARQLGEVLRIVVEGTMQVLKARNDIRREFRLPTTQLARKDNNPLKFSADAADALHKLLIQRSPAYLDTVSSFADAFDDVRLHQLAMLESLRTAFDALLAEFEPSRLESQLARQGGRGAAVLGLGGRSKLWDAYAARFKELTADRDFAFRRLFGEEFGKAYELALERGRRAVQAARQRESVEGQRSDVE